MPVAIERRLDRGVAELRLDVLGMGALRDEQARIGVAQVVEPDPPDARATQHPCEVALGEILRIERVPLRSTEHQLALEPTRQARQHRAYGGRRVDGAARAP